MNDHPSALFTVSYRMERGDHVAMTEALSRRSPLRVALECVLYLAALALLALAIAGSPERWVATMAQAFSLPLAVVTVPLVLAGPVILARRAQIAGLVAAALYSRHAMADRDVTVHLTAEGIEGGATDPHSRFGWAAVTRLVETPRHLFIQVSRREALIVPRRAVANEDVYNNLRGFVRARTGLSTR